MKIIVRTIILSLIFGISVVACRKHEVGPKLKGHIAFIHIGEENSHIYGLLVTTGGDTSGVEYKDIPSNTRAYFILKEIFPTDNATIETDSIVYKSIKGQLLNMKTETQEDIEADAGTFQVFVDDNRDSLNFVIPRGKAAYTLFSKLDSIAQKYHLGDASERFSYYKWMEPH